MATRPREPQQSLIQSCSLLDCVFLSLEPDAADGGGTVPAALRSSVITEGGGAGTTSATQDGSARM